MKKKTNLGDPPQFRVESVVPIRSRKQHNSDFGRRTLSSFGGKYINMFVFSWSKTSFVACFFASFLYVPFFYSKRASVPFFVFLKTLNGKRLDVPFLAQREQGYLFLDFYEL